MSFPELVRKYLPLWVGLSIFSALLVGYYFPGVKALKPAIPFLLIVMLYPMMINLRVEEIGKALRDPKVMGLALLMNFLLTPILGALWAHMLFKGTDSYLPVGFILKVTVPCSGMVAAWTGYAKGRIESALIIVALSLFLAIPLVPVWMWFLARVYVSVDPVMILMKMFLIVVLPLAAGLITRKILLRFDPEGYKKLSPMFPTISSCGMLIIVFVIISCEARLIVPSYHWVLLIILGIGTLYPFLFSLAVLLSKALQIPYGDAMALGYSVTAKNHAITIALAMTSFGGGIAVLPAAVAPVVQIPIMLTALQLSDRIKGFLRR